MLAAAAIAAGLFTATANAQEYARLIRENPERSCSEYHYYEYLPGPETPAPKGYKPFYISHYNRHGSRYYTSGGTIRSAIEGLSKANEAGLLTEEGKLLLRQLDTLHREHQGMYGMLTERGGEELRGIGRRMAENYRKVFKGRNEVECVSSYWPRCLMSMANLVTALDDEIEGLDYHYVTGPKYLDYISMDLNLDGLFERSAVFEKKMAAKYVESERIESRIFTDKEKAAETIDDVPSLIRSIYYAGSISPNTIAHPDILSHFDVEELISQWIVRSDRMYYRYGISAEEGDYVQAIAKPLIYDIVEKADAALEAGSDRAADLRFGHDVGLLPLVGALGIETMEERWDSEKAHEHWYSFDKISMASNLQMVFYRNRKGEVLVKLVYNERETSIPALESFSGPYYRWSDLRRHFLNTADAIPDDDIVKDGAESERTGV